MVFDREGQMVYCNQAFVQMTGWDARPGLRPERLTAPLPARCAAPQAYAPVAAACRQERARADTLRLVRPRAACAARLARL